MSGLLTLVRWSVGRTARSPAAWLVAACLATAWALVSMLSPLGLTTQSLGSRAPFYELAFLSALAGTSLACRPMAELGGLLSRTGPERRLAARLAVLVSGGCLGLALGALLPGALLVPGHLMTPGFAIGSSAGLLHLGALGLLLARAPLPTPLRPAALAAAAWLLPGAAAPDTFAGRLWHGMLDVSRHWDTEADVGLAGIARDAACVAALGLAAALLERGSAEPRRSRDLGSAESGSAIPR